MSSTNLSSLVRSIFLGTLLGVAAFQVSAGDAFSYRVPLSGSGIVAAATAGAPVAPISPPATAYQYYQWPTWQPKSADGYVYDWYTYDNNGDGQLDGTRVGLTTPSPAYSINLVGGARTVLAVEPLSPGLSFDTGAGSAGGNCFQSGMSPAPSVNGNGVACYIYPRYVVQKAGENKVAFKVKHTLGEDVIGMVFYGYDAPVIETNLAGTLDLGKVSSGYAVLTFHAANKGSTKGSIYSSSYMTTWSASCPGVSVSYQGVTLAPGAECDITVKWASFEKSPTLKLMDMLGVQVRALSVVTWSN